MMSQSAVNVLMALAQLTRRSKWPKLKRNTSVTLVAIFRLVTWEDVLIAAPGISSKKKPKLSKRILQKVVQVD